MLQNPALASGGGLDLLAKASNHWCFQAYAKMFEIGVISIVVLAVGYWVTLWLMGRRDDVLHGDFVHPEQGAEGAAKSVFPAPPFPAKNLPANAFPGKAFPAESFPANSFPGKPFPVRPPAGKSVAANVYPTQASPAQPGADRLDTLQSLLASIKRDLKDASQL
jgi:hypothetical protein